MPVSSILLCLVFNFDNPIANLLLLETSALFRLASRLSRAEATTNK